MEITSVKTHLVSIPYNEAKNEDDRHYAKETVDGRWVLRNVVVQIDTDEGISGYGEATHAPSVWGETAESTTKVVELFSSALEGLDPFDVVTAHERMNAVARRGNNAAKNAVDVALHDVMGKALGVPVYQLLGGQTNPEFRTQASPAARSPEQVVSDIADYVDEGYELFKLKMSGQWRADLERIEAILDHFGSEITVSLDANQGFTRRDIFQIADEIERSGAFEQNLVFEQPLDAADLDGLAELRQKTSVPVMVDEAVLTPSDLRRVIEKGAADIVSIKPPKAPGYYHALQMIGMAEAANLAYTIDGITEFKLASTTNAHLATAAPNPFYGGCTAHTSLTDDIVAEGGVELRNGRASVPDAPGLGIERFNPEYVPNE